MAALFAIWALCFASGVRSLGHPALLPPLAVDRAEDGGYPILTRLAPWGDAETELRSGDRLVRLGRADLRGVGPLGFYARFMAEAKRGEPLPRVTYERDARRGEARIPTPLRSQPPLLPSLGFALSALVVAIRASPTPLAKSLSRASLVMAIAAASPATGGVALNYAGLAVGAVGWTLIFPLFLRLLLLFERGAPPASPWSRVWPWLFAAFGPLTMSTFAGFPLDRPLGIRLMLVMLLGTFVLILALVARVYRASNPIERRQIRWVALGFYAGLAPTASVVALLLGVGFVTGEWRSVQPWLAPSYSFGALIPLSFFLAARRYNLLDVDRLLSAAASYNVLLVVLLGGALVVVPRAAEAASSWIGIDPAAGQVALSLALAAAVVPAHRRLRPAIDRIFFADRHALERGIGELLAALAACTGSRALTQRAGEGIVRLFHPEACIVYADAGGSFQPIFVAGRAVPPAFEASSLLVHTLRERSGPLALSAAGRRPDAAALDPFDRAALQALEADVVVPVRREALAAFVCLGPKRSGDVYTPMDLSLLRAVAETISQQLRRFDQEAVIQEAREMQASLRRYVPDAVAEQLAGGAEPASTSREVTVLFVDVRGYTSFSESRRSEEVFSMVNRYTEAVSETVRRHGGSVVEFHGDGLMAVFGAPRELAHKERAAVEAGRAILSAVSTLPGDGGAPLSVGVGVATGEAYVGSIRAADRLIWTAIGNTTNLAARLQALTRDLDAAIAIDAATHDAAGAACADFAEHAETRIRGRSEPLVVWALPLAGASDAAAAGR